MPAIEIPHLKMPLTVVDGRALAVEQDSDEEILQAAETVLRYEIGHRVDLPDFGLSDQAFRQGGADREEVREAIEAWEPRARPIVEDAEDGLEAAETLHDGIHALRAAIQGGQRG